MAVEVTVKKWGHSLGIILPKELVEERNLKKNKKITIQLIEKADLSDVFGSLKRKMSGQRFKDLARAGWE